MIISDRIFLKSITVLLGAVMLLSCKNDMRDVAALGLEEPVKPAMSGENIILTYSDSARIKYKVITPEVLKFVKEKENYQEFPQGIYAISYDIDGQVLGTVKSKYAKNLEDEMIWELRNEVIVVSGEKKLETELLFWDTKNGKIYTNRYVRLTDKGNLLEGHNGLTSDQELNNPVIHNTSGEVEFEMQNQ